MNAGKLDRRITIQSVTEAQDNAGQPVQTDVLLATVWAQVEALRGREPFQGDQFNAQQVTVFTIRYRDDVDATMQIIWEGEEYDVQSVKEIGRREGLEISALALVTA
jgi:SPP1 family predicted phage head-tail adaptor